MSDLENDSDIPEPKLKQKVIPFWTKDPNILLQSPFDLFPVNTMTYEQKLNAVTRSILIISIISIVLTRSIRLTIIAAITIGAIALLYARKEPFSPAVDLLKQENRMPTDVFLEPSPINPFGNVMLSDYDYNVNKKPAPPSTVDVLQQAKQLVELANPGQPDIADKLFQDLGDELVFEQSMRQFYSNPNTTIPNDQDSFAKFCYGSMVSCKEGNEFACARNLSRHIN